MRLPTASLYRVTVCTRPDLCFILSKLSQYFTKPTEQHWGPVKHVLRYLRMTKKKCATSVVTLIWVNKHTAMRIGLLMSMIEGAHLAIV